MPKKLTLGLGLLMMAGAVSVQAETYRIRQGDTISQIAARFHCKTRDILRANGLTPKSRLKLGQALTIPTASLYTDRRSTKQVPAKGGTYVVRNGDHDWSIAKRFGTTPNALRRMNPGVNWRNLQLGQRLSVPQGTTAASPVAKISKADRVIAGGTYAVRDGDNDWIIARRLNTKPSVLRKLNPGLNWSRIQVGQSIRVPGGPKSVAAAKPSANVAKLRSRYAVVAREDATIRRSPSISGDAVATVDRGTRVVVLDRDGDWYRLRFPKGTEGWMRGDLLQATSAPKAVVAKRKAKRAERNETVVVAAKPPKKPSPKVARRADEVTSHKTTETYAMVAADGDSQDKILNRAQSMRGVRYRWGAASRSATDCSGFTSQVFKSTGYKLPRTSAEQSKIGAVVPRGQLKKGDLVFFRTRRGARVSHVGIYMGNGKFIHASSGGGKVQVNSLSDSYYNKRFVTARRVVKSTGKSKKSADKRQAEVIAEPPVLDPQPIQTDGE